MNMETIERFLMIAAAIAAIVSAVLTSQQAIKSITSNPSIVSASGLEPCLNE